MSSQKVAGVAKICIYNFQCLLIMYKVYNIILLQYISTAATIFSNKHAYVYKHNHRPTFNQILLLMLNNHT